MFQYNLAYLSSLISMTSFDSISNKTKQKTHTMVQEERQRRLIPGFYMHVHTYIPTQTCVSPHKLAVRSNLTAGLEWGGLEVKKKKTGKPLRKKTKYIQKRGREREMLVHQESPVHSTKS